MKHRCCLTCCTAHHQCSKSPRCAVRKGSPRRSTATGSRAMLRRPRCPRGTGRSFARCGTPEFVWRTVTAHIPAPLLAAKVRSARYNRCSTQCAEPSEKLYELALCTAQATFVRRGRGICSACLALDRRVYKGFGHCTRACACDGRHTLSKALEHRYVHLILLSTLVLAPGLCCA